MIALGSLKSRNLRPPFEGRPNLPLNHHNRRRHASRRYARYGQILALSRGACAIAMPGIAKAAMMKAAMTALIFTCIPIIAAPSRLTRALY